MEITDEILSPIHPGEVLLVDFMKPLGLSPHRLANELGVTPVHIRKLVNGQLAITADTAMRLARYFGTSAADWLQMQIRYDLDIAVQALKERITRDVMALPQQR